MKGSGIQKGIILLIGAISVGIAVYFGYINRRAPSSSEDPVDVTEIQNILLLNFETSYPPTAREAVSDFCRIYKALYGEDASAEQITAMGGKLLELYDDELVAHQITYEESLLQEVRRKKNDGYVISTYHVASANDIITRRVDGNDLSYVNCMITMRKGSQLSASNYLFVLRKEASSGRWKIFGWTVTSDDD